MVKYIDAATMKQIDYKSINEVGIPSMVLMERASLKVAKNIIDRESLDKKIIVLSGVGNNGGDGICTARILKEYGYKVEVHVVGNMDKCSVETGTQISIAKNCGVCFVNQIDFNEYDIIIDSIFGIGLCRDVQGSFYDIIEQANNAHKVVYSVDVPSGINTDTGAIQGIAIKAYYTITFGVNKKGLILHPGRVYAGKVIVEDIGFPKHIIDELTQNSSNVVDKKIALDNNNVVDNKHNNCFLAYNRDNYKDYLPKRKSNSNKGTYGRVLVVAGSKNMAGACYFSAKAAYRIGAGLVQIFTCEENREILQQLIPEAIMTTYLGEKNLDSLDDLDNIDIIKKVCLKSLKESLDWATCVVVGPGLGTGDLAKAMVKYLLENCNKPMVVDADAINIISNMNIDHFSNVILTPHLKGMSRLIKCDIDDIRKYQSNPRELYDKINGFDNDFNNNFDKKDNVLVLKDATTLILNNEKVYVNTSGNNGLATGGSGDVLTGIIAGLLAQGLDNIEAASLGVYLHGLAAENYTESYNCYSLNASDLLDSLQNIEQG